MSESTERMVPLDDVLASLRKTAEWYEKDAQKSILECWQEQAMKAALRAQGVRHAIVALEDEMA